MTTLSRSIREAALTWPLGELHHFEREHLWIGFVSLDEWCMSSYALNRPFERYLSTIAGRTYMLLVAEALEN